MKDTVDLLKDIEKEFNERLNVKGITYELISKQHSITNLTSDDEEDIVNKNKFIKYINTYYKILYETIEDFYYLNDNEKKNKLIVFKKHYSLYFTKKLKEYLK